MPFTVGTIGTHATFGAKILKSGCSHGSGMEEPHDGDSPACPRKSIPAGPPTVSLYAPLGRRGSQPTRPRSHPPQDRLRCWARLIDGEASNQNKATQNAPAAAATMRLEAPVSERDQRRVRSHLELRTARGAFDVPALALQREHRRRLRVLGAVLDVIDADRFIRTCPPDERPSGCSITSVSQPLCVAGFLKRRGGEEQGRSSLFDLLSPEQCCFHLRRSQSQDVRHLARTHVACHDHSRVCGARRPIRLRNVCARQRRASLPRHSSR